MLSIYAEIPTDTNTINVYIISGLSPMFKNILLTRLIIPTSLTLPIITNRLASNSDVVFPVSVAAPSWFENIDIHITGITGDILNFLATINTIGAIISTVATLSINADTRPANTAKATVIHFVFEVFLIIYSDSNSGIFDSINSDTVPIVPNIINSTLKSISFSILLTGNIPNNININADIRVYILVLLT